MKSIQDKTTLIIDLFFCVVFMPILILLGPAHYLINDCPAFVIVSCCYLYVCYFILKFIRVPHLVITRRYRQLALIVGALIAGNWLLTLYPLPAVDFVTPMMSEFQTRVRDYGIYLNLWLMFSLVIGFALTTSLVMELYGQLLLKRKIEAQRDKAQLAVFKAQISPHFLFNTLNSLYSLVIGTSVKAEDAFIKFTDLLKYTYVSAGNETVKIKDEIAYIGNYIDLHRIRLNQHTAINWICDVDEPDTPLPPMIMLTFVENAFKYGASTSRDCEITISLKLKNKHLTFSTANSIMKHADEFRTEVPVGIDNCRARLAAIYPDHHHLETSQNDGIFRLKLEIDLN